MRHVVRKTAIKELIHKMGMYASKDAIEKIAEVVDEEVEQMIERAAKIARHAKRKTIKAEDIKLAIEY